MQASNDDGPRSWLDAAVELLGRAGTRGTVRVQGASMVPTLIPGSLLLVDFAPGRTRPGDILLFRQGGTLVVHRLLARVRSRRAGPCLRTRGDGRLDLDPPLLDRDVVGRVVAIRRRDRWRTLEGPAPRVYARLLAWHDHFWAAAAWLGGRIDSRLSMKVVFRLVTRLDRGGLRVADAALFRLVHREIPAAEGASWGQRGDASE